MTAKKHTLRLNYKFWIETDAGEGVLGEGKWQLLKAIRDTGSLKEATEQRGLAYRQTWDKLKKIEEHLGFKLIDRRRGGAKGGETVLTEKGEKFVDFFNALYQKTEKEMGVLFDEMLAELKNIMD
ncbi:MAG: winged helix-turn-helix domain-containing protein [Bacteroidales bacterium]